MGNALARFSRPSGVLLAAAWYGLIWAVSAHPMLGRPGRISGSWLLNTGHSLLFGLLALCWILCLPRRERWPQVRPGGGALVLGLVLALGILDELHQSYVPGRVMSVSDVFTDLTGAACVLWICAYCGSTTASERGLRGRLWLGLAACFAAGGLATFLDGLG